MDLANWKEVIIALFGGGILREITGRIWRSASRENEMAHDEAITEKIFNRAAELETKLLGRITVLEEAMLKGELACREEIRKVRQEYEVRMAEAQQKHIEEVAHLHSELGKCAERCSRLERDLAKFKRAES